MRAHLIAVALLGASVCGNTAFAGDSAAIFANTSAAAAPAVLLVQYAGGSTSLSDIAAGNYDQTGVNTPDNYLAGICGSSDGCLGDDLVRRDYFSFDVSSLPGKVTAATLSIYNPDATVLPFSGFPVAPGYISASKTLAYTLYSVTSPESAVAGSATDGGIFYDLGYGKVLGRKTVSASSDGKFVSIALNSQALTEINAGGDFTLGGSAIPEPAPLALVLLGAGMVVLARVRPRRTSARAG